ncbi:hypothetical protein [Hoylesella pleuritidis]|uniref:hypothetical protein n=1 Tax=Hoylesella pleuritidis TaxID=407975 RepID=UPI0028E3EA9D|nr:hypothetical protein [Hoylesella pleuritidis]
MNKDKWLGIVFAIGSCPSGILRAIGFFVLAPLLYNACEYLFNTGNTDGLKYVDTYIKDSKIISVSFPHGYDQTWLKIKLIATDIDTGNVVIQNPFIMIP